MKSINNQSVQNIEMLCYYNHFKIAQPKHTMNFRDAAAYNLFFQSTRRIYNKRICSFHAQYMFFNCMRSKANTPPKKLHVCVNKSLSHTITLCCDFPHTHVLWGMSLSCFARDAKRIALTAAPFVVAFSSWSLFLYVLYVFSVYSGIAFNVNVNENRYILCFFTFVYWIIENGRFKNSNLIIPELHCDRSLAGNGTTSELCCTDVTGSDHRCWSP